MKQGTKEQAQEIIHRRAVTWLVFTFTGLGWLLSPAILGVFFSE